MAIDGNNFKLTGGEASRMRKANVEAGKQAETNAKDAGSKGLANALLGHKQPATPAKAKPTTAQPKPDVSTDTAQKQQSAQRPATEQKRTQSQPRDRGAEGAYQKARQAGSGLARLANSTKAEQPKPQDAPRNQKGAGTTGQTKQSAGTTPTHNTVNQQGANVQVAGQKNTQQKGNATDASRAAAKAAPKPEAEDGSSSLILSLSKDKTKVAQPKGEAGKQISTNAGMEAAGRHAKVKDTSDDKNGGPKKDKPKKTGEKGGKGAKVAYAGPAEQDTLSTLSGLLKGNSGESPFDNEPANETAVANVTAEPVTWNTGVRTYTNNPALVDSERVRGAAIEHRQRTEKPIKEEVNYSNWDFRNVPITERFVQGFVSDTKDALGLARQIITNAREAKDPRGFGTIC